MKVTRNWVLVLTIIGMLCSCAAQREEKAKDAVRSYLNEKRVYDFVEREWGSLDSIFTPHRLKGSYNLAKAIIERDIAHYEYVISDLKFNEQKNGNRISLLRDSVQILKDSVQSITDRFEKMLVEGKNNRECISLVLTYKNIIGGQVTAKYIFVFNENSLSVSHHMDQFGEIME